MTKRQIKIAENILKYKKLDLILQKSNVMDADELQDIVGYKNLDFEDYAINETTVVTLENSVIEELEMRRVHLFELWFTRGLAIIAIIISIIALLKP